MAAPIIKVEGLSKTFISKERKKGEPKRKKEIHALKGVNLEVADGEVFGLLGPNGAGKTTLIKCLTTLLLPTGGTAWVNGYNITSQEDQVRASIGCMLMGDRGLYWKLTGRENLDYFGALYHVPKADRLKRIDFLIDLLRLGDFVDRTVETYSSGQRMIVAFAKALVNDAPILFLDEPTVTMDVPTARELRKIVKDMNEAGKRILSTPHPMRGAGRRRDAPEDHRGRHGERGDDPVHQAERGHPRGRVHREDRPHAERRHARRRREGGPRAWRGGAAPGGGGPGGRAARRGP